MKQWITEEQFNELTEPQKEIWFQWCVSHHYTFQELYSYHTSITTEEKTILNFPSIGEMITFLDERKPRILWIESLLDWEIESEIVWDESNNEKTIELSDFLWDKVKKELENYGK